MLCTTNILLLVRMDTRTHKETWMYTLETRLSACSEKCCSTWWSACASNNSSMNNIKYMFLHKNCKLIFSSSPNKTPINVLEPPTDQSKETHAPQREHPAAGKRPSGSWVVVCNYRTACRVYDPTLTHQRLSQRRRRRATRRFQFQMNTTLRQKLKDAEKKKDIQRNVLPTVFTIKNIL